MDDSTLTWIVVAAAVVLLLILLFVVLRGRRGKVEEARRAEAAELRQKAEADRLEVHRREAEAAKVDAEARMAQAEADARAADAARLQAEAHERTTQVTGDRAEVDDRLRRADALDPDVPTDGTPASHGDHVARDRPVDGPDGPRQGA